QNPIGSRPVRFALSQFMTQRAAEDRREPRRKFTAPSTPMRCQPRTNRSTVPDPSEETHDARARPRLAATHARDATLLGRRASWRTPPAALRRLQPRLLPAPPV